MSDDIDREALIYHRMDPPGKLAIVPTKPMANQRDLALAYSPGVAAACMVIVDDPAEAATVTARANLVGVVTNGTAVLGLGNIGALASKPVMEGKAVLFKKFANIDVFDIEVDESKVDEFVECVARLEPTFGGINLEDIGAPACFEIEEKLRERMGIPVFHDDQHGTAIVVAAAIYNALRVVKKDIKKVRLVASGAGAAALSCLNQLLSLGMPLENITVCDRSGVIHKGRANDVDKYKRKFAIDTDDRTLSEAIDGADIFLGLSGPGALQPEDVKKMGKDPIIMALANPTPEIMPELAHGARPDVIMGTGRSDYPNQVNNVLCFPFIFRGALDCGATTINEEMKLACVKALADLAMAETSDIVQAAFGGEAGTFGPEKLLPKPFDPRLIIEIAPAIAKAAMDTGVATRPIKDFDEYRRKLTAFVFRSGQVMRPIFDKARADPKRVVYTEGEEVRTLRAAQVVVDDGIAKPIIIGRRDIVERGIEDLGLRLAIGENIELVDPQDDPRYAEYAREYHAATARVGVSPVLAREVMRTNTTAIGAMMVKRGEADALICGAVGQYKTHLDHLLAIIGKADGVQDVSALSLLILKQGTYFICDTHVSPDPTAREVAEMVRLSAEEVRRFGIEPKVALLSHSNFGSRDTEAALKMREATAILHRESPDLEVEGEMHADAAVDASIRERVFPESNLSGNANLLVMPSLDSANIAYNLMKVTGEGLSVGPMLIGMAKPVHIMTQAVTTRGVVNMTAYAVVDAQGR
ncbi:MAG: NADP-dependent malic enzyme [Rhodospirillaceae bacterium]|jgi:malate dehydrogenase (oxaloacetate-decarboxylating)(NADP+)|nr:NADP-dependent malic enzyme [Rhodospirillaceae bacterium]MBT5666621.1 NADP-dependent malic enzyme [Rhodospirillaceae bacterium]